MLIEELNRVNLRLGQLIHSVINWLKLSDITQLIQTPSIVE